MAAAYDHYAYSAAKTNDFDSQRPNPHPYISEDESFNPASIPDRSKAYDDLPGNHDNLNYHDEEQGYAMHEHAPDGTYNAQPLQADDSRASLVHNAADTGRGYQNLGPSCCQTTRMP